MKGFKIENCIELKITTLFNLMVTQDAVLVNVQLKKPNCTGTAGSIREKTWRHYWQLLAADESK